MSFNATCPECDKSIRLRDDVAGKKIKCPECAHKFVANPPGAEDEGGYDLDEAPKKKKRRRDREDDDDDDRDNDDRPTKKKGRDVPQVATPMGPMVWAIMSIVCLCGPIGALCGFIALGRISSALNDLPDGRRGESARKTLNFGWIIAWVGIGLNSILAIVGIVLKLMKYF